MVLKGQWSIAFENRVAPILNLIDSFNNSIREMKLHLLKQPCHFILLLNVFELYYCFTGHRKSNAVPGERPSQFITFKKPIWSSLCDANI